MHAAWAEDFGTPGGRARSFPGGYLKIATLLRPGVPWVSWKFVRPPGRRGVVFDGLVRLGDRWAWFPKPWRAVFSPAPERVRHWLE